MITFRLARISDAKSIHNLMWSVYEQLPDKSTFVPDSYDWVCEHIEKRGFILIGEDQEPHTPVNTLPVICYFLVRYPALDEDNLGRDIGLTDTELLKVAMMDSCVVAPAYRGHHLQKKLFALAEEHINSDCFSYLMGTASPENKASCRSFEQSGYTCVIEKEKYGGKQRKIYLKKLDL